MKGRPKRYRRIQMNPKISGLKPYGPNINRDINPIILHYEEYEAFRLNDYENKNQTEAAELMQISRPTFTRIYMRARKKVAAALVEGREILIEGGTVYTSEEWSVCNDCHSVFNVETNLSQDNATHIKCPLCGSLNITSQDTY